MNSQNGSHLKHYGVKGMKWGVRKELTSAGQRIGSKATSFVRSEPTKQYLSKNPARAVRKNMSLGRKFAVGSLRLFGAINAAQVPPAAVAFGYAAIIPAAFSAGQFRLANYLASEKKK